MRPANPSSDAAVDTLKLSDEQWNEVLERLESGDDQYEGIDRRHYDHRRYGLITQLIIRVIHPGGSEATYLVRSRDISRDGVCFLHGSYLHPGTHCRVVLLTNEHEGSILNGTVVRCRHVLHQVHEVGVHFPEPIETERFVSPHG